MRDIFLKKRMNLLILSLVVYFIETTDIKIEKINILGTSLLVENPNVVNLWIWVIFLYFLIMYYYYFKIIDKNSEVLYKLEVTKKILFLHYVNDKFFTKLGGIHKEYYQLHPEYVYQDSELLINNDLKILLKFKRRVIERKDDVFGTIIQPSDVYININRIFYLYSIIKSFIKTSIVTKYFFEYYLPLVISAIVIVTKIYTIISTNLNGCFTHMEMEAAICHIRHY